MHITSIDLKNFRCFSSHSFDLDSRIVLLEGKNGSGKTTVLEGLYYGCYLRSFRTHLARDIISFNDLDTKAFFVKIHLQHEEDLTVNHTVQVGYSQNKKVVKIDQKSIVSHKQLLDFYRVVSVCEDDLILIKGSPEYRRSFIDQTILLANTDFSLIIKDYKHLLQQRNMLLQKRTANNSLYQLWTEQLWEKTRIIQEERTSVLRILEHTVNELIQKHFDDTISIAFLYNAEKKSNLEFEQFCKKNSLLYENEVRYGRSLFGAHLDDFVIEFQKKHSRIYASRGQQKLLLLLLKIAQVNYFKQKKGGVVFLLDDFLVDFDTQILEKILSVLLDLGIQCIITSPIDDVILKNILQSKKVAFKNIRI